MQSANYKIYPPPHEWNHTVFTEDFMLISIDLCNKNSLFKWITNMTVHKHDSTIIEYSLCWISIMVWLCRANLGELSPTYCHNSWLACVDSTSHISSWLVNGSMSDQSCSVEIQVGAPLFLDVAVEINLQQGWCCYFTAEKARGVHQEFTGICWHPCLRVEQIYLELFR